MLWRLNKEFSQDEAARFIRMSPVTYRRCESGQYVHPLTAARVANRIKIPLQELRISARARVK